MNRQVFQESMTTEWNLYKHTRLDTNVGLVSILDQKFVIILKYLQSECCPLTSMHNLKKKNLNKGKAPW